MAVDDSWNHEQYRSRFEPLEHWELKEEFILRNKKEIQEDQLICLMNVYVNMTLMGCRYPAAVATRVRALSQGLGHSYRQRRDGKLMRTFVSASDAATAKVRRSDAPTTKGICAETGGSAGPDEGGEPSEDNGEVNGQETTKGKKKKKKKSVIKELESEERESEAVKRKSLQDSSENNGNPKKKQKKCLTQEPECHQDANDGQVLEVSSRSTKLKLKNKFPCNSTIEGGPVGGTKAKQTFSDAISKISAKIKKRMLDANKNSTNAECSEPAEGSSNAVSHDPSVSGAFPRGSSLHQNKAFRGLTLVKLYNREYRAAEILNNSFTKGEYYVKKSPSHIVAYVHNTEVARLPLSAASTKALPELLARESLKVLAQSCPLMMNKSQGREANVCADGSLLGIEDYTEEKIERISQENVGSKLLQLMGWTGAGLGKHATGRVDPVQASMREGRAGLGYTGSVGSIGLSDAFKRKVYALLQNFSKDSMSGATELEELVFPCMFTKEQRAYIHSLGRKKFQLKSSSYGQGEKRYLVVKPNITIGKKVKQVIEKGGETNLFKVHLPGTYQQSVFNLVPL